MSTEKNINPWADISFEEEDKIIDQSEVEETGENSPAPIQREYTIDDYTPPAEEPSQKSDNLAFLIAQDLLRRGFIDPSFDIPEDVDDGKVLELIEESGIRKASAMYEEYLHKQGINEKNINILRAIENGATQEEIKEVVKYQKYAEMTSEEFTKEEKMGMIKEYLKGRGWTEDEIRDRLEVIEYDNKKFEKDFENGKTYFQLQVSQYNDYQENLTKQKEDYDRQVQQRNKEIMERAFNEGIIYDEKMSPKEIEVLRQQVFNKSYPMDFGNGEVINVSPFEAFMYDITNNLETQLYMFKLATFREVERKLMEEQAEKKAEDTFLKKLKKDVILDKSAEKTNLDSPKKKVYNISGG